MCQRHDEIVINNVQFATISWGWYLWGKVLWERLHWSGCYFVLTLKFDCSGVDPYQENISLTFMITFSNHKTKKIPLCPPFNISGPVVGKREESRNLKEISHTVSSRSLTRENFDSGREATVGVDFMAWVLRARGCKVKSFTLRITLSDLWYRSIWTSLCIIDLK